MGGSAKGQWKWRPSTRHLPGTKLKTNCQQWAKILGPRVGEMATELMTRWLASEKSHEKQLPPKAGRPQKAVCHRKQGGSGAQGHRTTLLGKGQVQGNITVLGFQGESQTQHGERAPGQSPTTGLQEPWVQAWCTQ